MAGFTIGAERVDCRVWCNYNGTGTPAIRDSNFVSTLADVKVGTQRVNFSVTMGNNTFVCVGMAGLNDTSQKCVNQNGNYESLTSTRATFQTTNADGTLQDMEYVHIAIFGT
jgi:hypothetical protein